MGRSNGLGVLAEVLRRHTASIQPSAAMLTDQLQQAVKQLKFSLGRNCLTWFPRSGGTVQQNGSQSKFSVKKPKLTATIPNN